VVFDNIPIIFGSVWNWRRRWPRRTGGATAVITIAAGHGRQKRHHRTTAPLHRRASCTVAGTAVWLRQWMWMWLGILILAFRVPAQETIICLATPTPCPATPLTGISATAPAWVIKQ